MASPSAIPLVANPSPPPPLPVPHPPGLACGRDCQSRRSRAGKASADCTQPVDFVRSHVQGDDRSFQSIVGAAALRTLPLNCIASWQLHGWGDHDHDSCEIWVHCRLRRAALMCRFAGPALGTLSDARESSGLEQGYLQEQTEEELSAPGRSPRAACAWPSCIQPSTLSLLAVLSFSAVQCFQCM